MDPPSQKAFAVQPSGGQYALGRNGKVSFAPSSPNLPSGFTTITSDPHEVLSPAPDSIFSHPYGKHHDASTSTVKEEKGDTVGLSNARPISGRQVQTFHTLSSTSNARGSEERFGLSGRFREGLNQITSSFSTLTQHLERQQESKKVAQLERDLTEAVELNHDLNARQKLLRRELEETNEKLERALKERDALRCLAGGGTLANSRKETDGIIQGKWKQLDFNICSLAHFLAKEKPRPFKCNVVAKRLRQLNCSWQQIFRDDDDRELLIRGYLWQVVTDRVFAYSGKDGLHRDVSSPLKMAQRGMISKNIHVLARDDRLTLIAMAHNAEQPLAPKYQRIARWRAHGWALAEELRGDDKKNLDEIIKLEVKRLAPFGTTLAGSSDRSEVKMWDEMKWILEGAAELDRVFMRSNAIFEINWGQGLQSRRSYNPDTMEATEWQSLISERSSVVFYMSPTLTKIGNADGHNYGQALVLVKASVVCD